MSDYRPTQGDIVMLDFTPQAGHEQVGRRPALVVSNSSFQRYTGLAIFCPSTNQIKDYPLHVRLDDRMKTTGEILCEHVKSLDYRARKATFVETVPDDLLSDVLDRVRMALD